MSPPSFKTKPTACFSVQASADPQIMPRVLELFAKRGLIPSAWHSVTAGHNRGELHIDVQIEGMTQELRDYVARCLRQIAGVETVLTSEKSQAKSA